MDTVLKCSRPQTVEGDSICPVGLHCGIDPLGAVEGVGLSCGKEEPGGEGMMLVFVLGVLSLPCPAQKIQPEGSQSMEETVFFVLIQMCSFLQGPTDELWAGLTGTSFPPGPHAHPVFLWAWRQVTDSACTELLLGSQRIQDKPWLS